MCPAYVSVIWSAFALQIAKCLDSRHKLLCVRACVCVCVSLMLSHTYKGAAGRHGPFRPFSGRLAACYMYLGVLHSLGIPNSRMYDGR